MKRLMAAIAVVVTGVSPAVAQVGDGPFGFAQGMSLQQVRQLTGNLESISPGLYRARSVPKPYSAFEYYTLTISPRHGLCKVGGVGKDIATDSIGQTVKTAFASLLDAVAKKYGPPDLNFDSVLESSVWKEPNEWMMGLVKEDRLLMAGWQAGKTAKPLPSKLSSILLRAWGMSATRGYLRLSYEFENFDLCMAERAKEQEQNL